MTDEREIVQRKQDHIAVVLSGGGRSPRTTTGLEHVRFEHCALPEMALSDVGLSTVFLGRRLSAPLHISSMTGGPRQAGLINARLAEAAQEVGIALAVGSQRVALESNASEGFDRSLRRLAPDVAIYANFGAAQLTLGYTSDHARRAIDMIEADGLIIHLNPLQEAVQSGGDTNWTGTLSGLERLVRAMPVPIIVKEVGFGLSASIVRKLADCGVAAIDVAGCGGTNWALVEAKRTDRPEQAAVASGFGDWGIPTAQAISRARAAVGLPIIGSGGIESGVDVAKAIRLGADLVGLAAKLLPAAVVSTDAVVVMLRVAIAQLRIVCFCTGSRDLNSLKSAALLESRAVDGSLACAVQQDGS